MKILSAGKSVLPLQRTPTWPLGDFSLSRASLGLMIWHSHVWGLRRETKVVCGIYIRASTPVSTDLCEEIIKETAIGMAATRPSIPRCLRLKYGQWWHRLTAKMRLGLTRNQCDRLNFPVKRRVEATHRMFPLLRQLPCFLVATWVCWVYPVL